jgi:hypothetical protein
MREWGLSRAGRTRAACRCMVHAACAMPRLNLPCRRSSQPIRIRPPPANQLPGRQHSQGSAGRACTLHRAACAGPDQHENGGAARLAGQADRPGIPVCRRVRGHGGFCVEVGRPRFVGTLPAFKLPSLCNPCSDSSLNMQPNPKRNTADTQRCHPRTPISALPEWLADLPCLTALTLISTNLEAFPPVLRRMPGLRVLDMEGCDFGGGDAGDAVDALAAGDGDASVGADLSRLQLAPRRAGAPAAASAYAGGLRDLNLTGLQLPPGAAAAVTGWIGALHGLTQLHSCESVMEEVPEGLLPAGLEVREERGVVPR